ncbi:MAG: glycosyltransferase family 4 protein [Planctomycetota bacterium]
MRIAHVITRMIVGGAQENTLLCCEDLIQHHGDEVLLITGPALGPEGDLLAQSRAGEARGPGATPAVAGRVAGVAEQGIRPQVPVALIPAMRRAVSPWQDWQSYRQLKEQLRSFRPDVVHTHSAKAGILGRMAATALRVPAIVHTVHGAPFHPYQSGLARRAIIWAERFGARRCQRLVSVADAMTDLLVEAGVAPREKFVTIYSGMDVNPFLRANEQREVVRRELGFQPKQVVIGKIARLFHLKGHEYLIAAARTVIQRCDNVRFLLVGDGILRAELEQEIGRLGLAEYFRFTGLVPPGRIPALLGAMDALVHVSLREGLARALPQALIAGKPVVSFDVDGAREVTIPGETGFLIPAGAVEPLAEALVKLATDAALRERLGQGGCRRFADQFRHETMTQQLRELYQKLLS